MGNIILAKDIQDPDTLSVQEKYNIMQELLEIGARYMGQGDKGQAVTYINAAICVAKSVAYQEIDMQEALENTTEGCKTQQ